MDIDEARKILRQEIQNAEEAERTLGSARLIVQGIFCRFPELTTEAPDWAAIDSPRGQAAVLQVLRAEEGTDFQVHEVTRKLGELGRLPQRSKNPAHAVRTALERLIRTPGSNVSKTTGHGREVYYSYSNGAAP